MPISPPTIGHLKGALANATLRGDHDDIARYKRDLTCAVLEKHITRTLAGAPPLTAEQRDRLTAVLHAPVAASSESTEPVDAPVVASGKSTEAVVA